MANVQRFTTWTNVDLIIRVPVTFDQGAPITTLIGATVDARIKTQKGAIVIGTAEVVNSATILVTFPRGTLPVGLCTGQVWVQIGPQAAMPYEFEAEVRPGFRPVP